MGPSHQEHLLVTGNGKRANVGHSPSGNGSIELLEKGGLCLHKPNASGWIYVATYYDHCKWRYNSVSTLSSMSRLVDPT